MNAQTEQAKEQRRTVVEGFTESIYSISVVLQKLLWSGNNKGKEIAAREYIETTNKLNVLRMLFLIGDMSFDDFVKQGKPFSEKLKTLWPIVNS